MLKTQFDTLEEILLATSHVVDAAGHNLHKGIPREIFVREFLQLHLTENIGIGTGEIIDNNSTPGDHRSQIDVVVYHKGFPKLHFGGGINAFLAEGVLGIVEVKSIVNKEALRQAILATRETKGLERHLIGPRVPNICSYVVGYKGPASMNQIYEWVAEIHAKEHIVLPELSPDIEKRVASRSPSLDLVVILGLGMFYYDTSPVGFLPQQHRDERPDTKWVWLDQEKGNLLFLFLHLSQIIGINLGLHVNLLPYLHGINIAEVRWGNGLVPHK